MNSDARTVGSRLLIGLAAAMILLAAACGDGDGVSRAELEANEAAERAEELEDLLAEQEDEDLRQELEDLREQLGEQDGGGDDGGGTDGGGNTGGGNTGGGNTGGGNTGGGGGPTQDCADNVSVNSVTSCPFALNMRDALIDSGYAEGTYSVFSPTTGETYDMTCVIRTSDVLCTGGNNAAVYVYP